MLSDRPRAERGRLIARREPSSAGPAALSDLHSLAHEAMLPVLRCCGAVRVRALMVLLVLALALGLLPLALPPPPDAGH